MKKKSVRALSLFMALALIMSVMIVPSSNVFAAGSTSTYTYTVTYSPNGGSGSNRAYSVAVNTYYTVSNQGFTRSGYVFNGWNTRADGYGTTYQNGSYIWATGNITLYAQWKSSGGTSAPNPRTVTYHPNGGSGSSVSVSVPINTNHTVLSQGFTRAGFTFVGYNTASNGSGTAYQVGSNLYVATDITLFAIWTTSGPTQPPRTVKYHPNISSGISSDERSYSVPSNTNHTVLSQGYIRTGYTFAGYNTASNGSGIAYQVGSSLYVTADITLFAMWTTTPVQLCTVMYHPNGGIGTEAAYQVPRNTPHIIPDLGYTRPGYNFAGYNTASNGTGTTYQIGDTIYVATDTTLFAMWTPAPIPLHTVRYHPNGGSGTETAYQVPANTNHTVFDQGFTRSGYTFVGWNRSSDGTETMYQDGDVINVATDITLFAIWEIMQFTITYSSNGGNEPDRTYTVDAFSNHTIFDQGFTRDGYTFVEWNTWADGTGNALDNGHIFWVYTDVTLYAQWSSNAPTFTVTYDANGGTGGLIDEIPAGSDHFIKTAQETNVHNLPQSFWFWCTRPDRFDPDGTIFYPGDKLIMDRDFYLYAIWRMVE